MSGTQPVRKIAGTVEARRLAELARAAGLGDSLDAALQGPQAALDLLGTDKATPLLVDVLRWHGTVLRDRGRTSDAEALYRRSIALATELAYEPGRAHGLNCLAAIAQRRGDNNTAAAVLTDALMLAQSCGETRLVGMIQQNLGIIADVRGNPAAALAHYLVSLRTFESSSDLQPLCWVLINLGLLHLKEERFEEAEAAFERGMTISRARGDLLSEGLLSENRGELCLTRGDIRGAEPAILRALEVAEVRDDELRRASALKLLGALRRLESNPGAAIQTLQHALTLNAVAEDALLRAETLYQLALALAADGDAEGARQAWTTALETFERISARNWCTKVRQRLTDGGSDRYL